MSLELLSLKGGRPTRISLTESVFHLLITGKTGCGKSALAVQTLIDSMIAGMPVSALDVTKPDGSGTFSFVHYIGGRYQDLRRGGNPLEPPDVRYCADDQERQEKLAQFRQSVAGLLLAMTISPQESDADIVHALVYRVVSAFYDDVSIAQRWQQAIEAGLGTSAWEEQPTLRDMVNYFSPERLQMKRYGERIREVSARMLLKLEGWLNRPLGESLCIPRQYEDNHLCVIYPLQSLDTDEAPVVAQRILNEITRKSLNYRNSVVFLDEAPILLQHDAIAATVAQIISKGRKDGTRMLIATQGPDAIQRSPFRAQILDNISVRLIGVIEESSVTDYENIFRYPRELLIPCSERGFYPSRQLICSHWLVDNRGILTPSRFFVNYLTLALCANQVEEVAARDRLLASFPEDAITAFTTFAHLLKLSFRSGQSIERLVDDWIAAHVPKPLIQMP
ncbi:MAG: hypothetical protein AAF821_00160 [Cyanobacteria bacterium P01_D01_bin.156]